MSYDTLMQRVWGGQFRGESNVLAVTVSTVRKALEEDDEPRLIQTVRGVGYVMRPPKGKRGRRRPRGVATARSPSRLAARSPNGPSPIRMVCASDIGDGSGKVRGLPAGVD